MAGMAQGTVDSLLGRLTSVILDEAQLLGGIRGDVEFIRDEMESMNGLLRYLTEAQHRDRMVRTWMKQVVDLARDCEDNVELYLRRIGGGDLSASHGLLGCLRRLLRLIRTIPARHRVAERIRELKVRAQDVGDRRQRYGVTVPGASVVTVDGTLGKDFQQASAGEEEDLRRRAILEVAPPDDWDTIKTAIDQLVKHLSEEPPPPQLRVFPIVGEEWVRDRVAQGVYKHSSVESSFDCQAWVYLPEYPEQRNIQLAIRRQVAHPEDDLIKEEVMPWNEEHVARSFPEYLKGKRFLMVFVKPRETRLYLQLHMRWSYETWGHFISTLLRGVDRPSGSAIIISTIKHEGVATWPSSYEIVTVESPTKFFYSKAEKVAAQGYYGKNKLNDFVNSLYPDAFAMKTFLHRLYVNASSAVYKHDEYFSAISECKRQNKSIANQMLMFCYEELPSKYRSCLLYLTIFPSGHIMRSTSLARRWISEGLITPTCGDTATVRDRGEQRASMINEATRYLDVLATGGFVHPVEISASGNIKRCTVHPEVRKFITRIARDIHFVDTNLPPHLAHHLSIYNRIGLPESHTDVNSSDIVACLPSLAASSQWQLLKMLDLEGCKGLKKNHLKSICKILLLKYLSLRNTDVTELPKQIKELHCLQTLDIRETKVRVLAKKAIVLPLLKHFLAGHNFYARNDTGTSEELVSAVQMPLGIQKMDNMETLSHVQVSNKELGAIAQLLKLRKLGVTLPRENFKLNDLFCQIGKLHRCLRSLSIRIDQPTAGQVNHNAEMVDVPCPPQFIENLNISGLTRGLPHMIQELHQLVKLTLTKSYIKEDMLRVLGKLNGLCYLRLQHKSYIERELAFKEDEFQSLKFLLVDGDDIISISFDTGAAPKLERIIWSFSTMEALSGLNHLPNLKKLEFNGDCNLDPLRAAIEAHPNDPVLKHNSQLQRQETTAAAASSSSAP